MNDTENSIESQLTVVRRTIESSVAVAHCSAEGFLLAFDGESGVDEAVLGDAVVSAGTLSTDLEALLGDGPPTMMIATPRGAVVMRRLADGSWLTALINDPSALGRTVDELGDIEAPSNDSSRLSG